MKVTFLFVVAFISVGVTATPWDDVKSPIETLKFRESLDKLQSDPMSFATEIEGRITNGNPARLGDFPYQVYMILTRSFGGSVLCGGSVNFLVHDLKTQF